MKNTALSYDEDEIQIDFEELAWNSNRVATRSRFTYTDLTGAISYRQVEAFALEESALEGWEVLSILVTPAERKVVLEVGELGREHAMMAG